MATLPLSGCGGNLSTLDPAGPAAAAIALLWWIMLAGAAVILLLVMAAFAWSFRPGARRVLTPRFMIVGCGVVFSSIVLTLLVGTAFVLGERLLPHPREPRPLVIEVVARQWQWEFRYPEAGDLSTLDRLHIPAGRDIDFTVVSEDVIHSFWIPRLGGKIDAIPGHTNRVRLHADRAGTYGGVCAEFCGLDHTGMRFTVIAHEAEDYAAALERAARDGGQP